MKWLSESLKIASNDLTFDIYIHETYKKSKNELIKYWSDITKMPTKVLIIFTSRKIKYILTGKTEVKNIMEY